jgi:hypothetical protein
MNILTILARFGTDQYPHAAEEIAAIFERQMPSVERSVIIVDNALPRDTVGETGSDVLMGGDNSTFEFSAFDRAVEFVGPRIWSYDLIHFATSAFNTLYVAYLDRFDEQLLNAVARRPVSVGHIDCFNEPVEVLHFRSQHWIRSCFFFMPPTEVKALGRFVSISDPRLCFSGNPDAPFREDAPLSSIYRRYITDWLTGGDIGQGVEWHSSFALTHATLPSFERKTLCIMNEQLLGIRLRALGCRLIDVTWLSTRIGLDGAKDVPWTTGWREQLADRDRDTLRLPGTGTIVPGNA